MANRKQNDAFHEHMRAEWPLDDAIEWIKNNLSPEDVFSIADLDVWAAESDYTKATDTEGRKDD